LNKTTNVTIITYMKQQHFVIIKDEE